MGCPRRASTRISSRIFRKFEKIIFIVPSRSRVCPPGGRASVRCLRVRYRRRRRRRGGGGVSVGRRGAAAAVDGDNTADSRPAVFRHSDRAALTGRSDHRGGAVRRERGTCVDAGNEENVTERILLLRRNKMYTRSGRRNIIQIFV